jgi:hypothetical protein
MRHPAEVRRQRPVVVVAGVGRGACGYGGGGGCRCVRLMGASKAWRPTEGSRSAVVLSDRETPLGTNRVAIVPNAVTLSGGNLTITYARRTKALP